MKTKVSVVALCGLLYLFAQSNAYAARTVSNQTCGIEPGKPLTNGYGPYDFTNPEHVPKFPIVINAHFTPEVERLVKGATGTIHSDISYTLRAIPNYHRALNAMSRYELQSKEPVELVARHYSAECFFKRAIYFQPNDPTTRMLYGIHLHKLERLQEAETLYTQALAMSPNNPEISYNLGLLYVDMNNIDKAKQHADVAYKGGYPLPGLRNRIARAQQGQ